MTRLLVIGMIMVLLSPMFALASERPKPEDLEKMILTLRYVLMLLIADYIEVMDTAGKEGVSLGFRGRIAESMMLCARLLELLGVHYDGDSTQASSTGR